jgi:hypothetical protein
MTDVRRLRVLADAPVRHIEAVRARDGHRSPAVTAMLECLRAAARQAEPAAP